MDAKTHQQRLLREIANHSPYFDDGTKLRPALRKAFMACPRHRFLDRFRLRQGGETLRLTKRNAEILLPELYKDSLVVYVDADGRPLPATNSEPGYVMHLLERLDLRRGQSVMEIGSGMGWLVSVMAQAVGPRGRAVGVEINADLASRSRKLIKGLGREIDLGNLMIVTGDGAEGYAPGAPYDRVTVTAGSQSFPAMLFDQVAVGGRVMIPLSLRGGGEEVFLMERQADCFSSLRTGQGWYVALTGRSELDGFHGVALETLALWRKVHARPCFEQDFWLGGKAEMDLMMRSHRFRTYLAKTEPGYQVFVDRKEAKRGKGRWPGMTFGLVDEKAGSMVLYRGHKLYGYGTPDAAKRLLRAYRRWTAEFMPPGSCFGLTVYRSGEAPKPGRREWLERRGDCDFVWSLPKPA